MEQILRQWLSVDGRGGANFAGSGCLLMEGGGADFASSGCPLTEGGGGGAEDGGEERGVDGE